LLTRILDNLELVNWINTIQSESLSKVSFYTLTTEFANYMKNDTDFDAVQVTGHSLGGGLSLITGAQAHIPAVGLSGPNALISGKSLKPPVTEEEMNRVCCNIGVLVKGSAYMK
jgi:lipase ATG15